MFENFISKKQHLEVVYATDMGPKKPLVYLHELEAEMTPIQIQARRQMVYERQSAMSSLFLEWQYPHYHERKNFDSGEHGQELVPLPSRRDDGEVTDHLYRVWWGTKWVPVEQIGDGTVIEAQARRYDENHDGFFICGGHYERQNPRMAICTRIVNPETNVQSSASEIFLFDYMPMNNSGPSGLADIKYLGSSMDLQSEQWSQLDHLLLALNEHFGENPQAPAIKALGNKAISS